MLVEMLNRKCFKVFILLNIVSIVYLQNIQMFIFFTFVVQFLLACLYRSHLGFECHQIEE
jgi:hypothetical protein